MIIKKLLIFALLLLFCVGGAAASQDEPRTPQPVSGTAEEAAAHLRALHFSRDFEGAVREGEALVKKFPEALELRAWHLLSLARLDANRAEAEADRMVDSAKESPWSWFALTGALNHVSYSKRGGEALGASEKVLALLPNHPDAIWLRAETMMRQGKYDDVVEFVDQNRSRLRNPAELLATKGNALYSAPSGDTPDERKFADALAAFELGRESDPTNVNAHHMAGTYLMRKRRNAEAYPLLKTALELAPNSTSIHRSYWEAVMGRIDISAEEKRKEVESGMIALLDRRGDYPDTLHTVSTLAQEFKFEEIQSMAEDRLLRDFPDSPEAEWVLVGRYRELRRSEAEDGFKDPQKKETYIRALREFIARPKHHRETLLGDAYRNLFFAIKDDPQISPQELLDVSRGMTRYEGINHHLTFPSAAKALAERKAFFREAEGMARAGLVENRKRLDGRRNNYSSQEEFEKAIAWTSAQFHDALGWVFFHEGRLPEAEKELLHAFELLRSNPEIVYHLGKVYEAVGHADKEEEFYIKGLGMESMGRNPCEQALSDLYARRHGNLDGYAEYRANIAETERGRRKERILAERPASLETPPPFALKNLEREEVSLAALKGRIIVINFWGTWCGPCVAELPEFQKLYALYKDDPGVAVLTINNDPDPDDVTVWMRKKSYDFIVLIDDGYVSRARVRAFPTTWFLDPDGRIAFVKVGWSEKLQEEFGWRIESLRAATQRVP